MHLHGALGVSNEMPFVGMMLAAEALGLADGPTEVHKITLARQLLKGYTPVDGLFPTGHLPTRREAARAHLADRSSTRSPSCDVAFPASQAAADRSCAGAPSLVRRADAWPGQSPSSGPGGPSSCSGAGGAGPRCRGTAGGA